VTGSIFIDVVDDQVVVTGASATEIVVDVETATFSLEVQDVGIQGPPGPVETIYPLGRSGPLTVAQGRAFLPVMTDAVLLDIAVGVGVAPQGGPLVVDIKRNGVSIFANPLDRPTIAAGTDLAVMGVFDTALVQGDRLTVDVVHVGDTIAGSELTVVLRVQRTA
jgi:hypothetical protein